MMTPREALSKYAEDYERRRRVASRDWPVAVVACSMTLLGVVALVILWP